MPDGTPILSKEELYRIECDYITGNYKSKSELARRNNLSPATLHAIIKRNGWDVQVEETRNKALKSIEKKVLSEGDSWVNRVKDRTLKDWLIVDKSLDTVASSSGEVDPETLLPYIRGRKLLDDMHRRALGMPDNVQVDLTSKGQSLGDSLLSAILKAREDAGTPKLTSEDVSRLLEAEIVEDDSEPKT